MFIMTYNQYSYKNYQHKKKKTKAKNKNKENIDFLTNIIQNNTYSKIEGPNKKSWSIHDLKSVKPLTKTQEDMFHGWFNDSHIIASGSAGTGKTFLACFLALNDILNNRQNKLIIVRSIVPTRDIGFLPGTIEEKISVYEQPYINIFWELIGRSSTYEDMKKQKLIEFMPTSFIRGLTWDNAIVIIDECENLTFHEINSIMTRLGNNTRIIVCGDILQTDLDNSRNKGSQGMGDLLNVSEFMNEFEAVHFTTHDIVRSGFVKSWITAVEQTTIG